MTPLALGVMRGTVRPAADVTLSIFCIGEWCPMSVWYLVYCKARQEDMAARGLEEQGYGVYLPKLETRRRRAQGMVNVVQPLFPRYLFVSPCDRQPLAPIGHTAGVSKLVRFGSEYRPVLGGFDESIEVEDWDLLLRLTRSYRVLSIPDLLFLYRSHASNYSNDRVRMLSQQDAIAEKHDELRSFIDFVESIRGLSIAGVVRNLSFLNCELTARAILRRLRKSYWRRRVSRRADGGSASTLPSE